MTVSEVVQALSLTIHTAPEKLSREVTGGYASDLLSRVVARAQPGNLWVTVQVHANVVAVAVLTDLAAVIIAEGAEPDQETVLKAESEGIPLLSTSFSTFEVVARLSELGVRGT